MAATKKKTERKLRDEWVEWAKRINDIEEKRKDLNPLTGKAMDLTKEYHEVRKENPQMWEE